MRQDLVSNLMINESDFEIQYQRDYFVMEIVVTIWDRD